MSSSASNCCLESTPCWHRLTCSIKTLFEHQNTITKQAEEIDFNQLGASSRIKYEDFERIFYQLLLIIDTQDTKRKFKGHYPARNKEEQNVFIDMVAKAINDRQPQLHSRRVASSQLRMFGGVPFRSLLSSLVRRANEREIEKLKSRLDLQSSCKSDAASDDNVAAVLLDNKNDNNKSNLNNYREPLDKLSSRVRSLSEELKLSLERLEKCRDIERDELQQAQELWCQVAPARSMERLVISKLTDYNQEQLNSIFRMDLSRLESIHADLEKALDRVNAISLPKERQQQQHANTNDKQAAPVKRLSQFIRDTKSKFDPDREFLRDTLQQKGAAACQPDRMLQQLVEHDQQMSQLIEMWRAELELAEEQLLRRPEIMDRYKQFELVIPKINLKRISITMNNDQANTINNKEAIEEILKQFPDQRAAMK